MLALVLASLVVVSATQVPTTMPATPAPILGGTFDEVHLEQLAASAALYPDPLLAHVLMASTYPLELVEAFRWVQAHPEPAGKHLETALVGQPWDPSVKSLCGFRPLLTRMVDHLDWAQDLGDAFLDQRTALLGAIQKLRRRALDAGNLRTGGAMRVAAPAGRPIALELTDSMLIAVPNYVPRAMFGDWQAAEWIYPALFEPPPAGQTPMSQEPAVPWGTALFAKCDWNTPEHGISIDVKKRNTFIDRTEEDARRASVKQRMGEGSEWKHDPLHRKNVGYRTPRVARQYGGSTNETRVARDAARGHAPPAKTADLSPNPFAGLRPQDMVALNKRGNVYNGSQNATYDRYSSYRGYASTGYAGFWRHRYGGYYHFYNQAAY